MKIRPIIALLILALAACLLPQANAASLKDADIDAMVKAEAPLIAQEWKLVPLFRIGEGSTIEMTASGTLEFGRDSLRSILTKVEPARQKSVVQWIVAHETWHQAQRRDFGQLRPEDLANHRLRECEADIMATQHLANLNLKEAGGREGEAKAKLLGATLKGIISELQAAEQSYGGAASHPSGAQRRTAIALGTIRSLLEHLTFIPEAEERQNAAAQIQRIVDYKDYERLEDWASRTCTSILHAGDGVSDLAELKPLIVFNKDGKPPVVDFQLPYMNTGNSSLSVVMQVMTIAVPRASPADADSWQRVDAITYRFDLAPGQQYTLTGRLTWAATADAFPRLLFPLSGEALYSAARGESQPGRPHAGVSARPLSPRLKRLELNLLSIANAAADQFKSIRGQPCRNTDGSKVCPLTINIPSSQSAEVTYEADGATRVEITLYEGKSFAEAEKAFASFRNDLTAIDPFQAYSERTTASGGKVLSYSPTSTSQFELRLSKPSSGTNYVIATVAPSAYSD